MDPSLTNQPNQAISPIFAPDGITVDHLIRSTRRQQLFPTKRKFFPGITNQFDVSYSSGDERGTFYLGFQDAHIYGVTPKDESRRDNFRVGGSRTYGKFTADYTASYNQRNNNIVGLSYNQTSGGVFSGRPIYFELINAPSNADITNYKDWAHNVYASPDGYFNAYATNPYWTIDNSRRKSTTYDLFGTVNLAFHFNHGSLSDTK
jgi:hypothetical protein